MQCGQDSLRWLDYASAQQLPEHIPASLLGLIGEQAFFLLDVWTTAKRARIAAENRDAGA